MYLRAVGEVAAETAGAGFARVSAARPTKNEAPHFWLT